MRDRKEILYNTLLEKGYKNLGSLESFSKNLEDENKLRSVYNAVSKDYDFGSFDNFSREVMDGWSYGKAPSSLSEEKAQPKSVTGNPLIAPESKPMVFQEPEQKNLQQLVDTSKELQETPVQNYAVPFLKANEDRRNYFAEAKEEADIDKRFKSSENQSMKDIAQNAYARFSQTERGKELQKDLADIQNQIKNRYAQEFLKSDDYKDIASKFKGEELNAKANDLFAQRYNEAIEKEMQPYYDAYGKEVQSRYGDMIDKQQHGLVEMRNDDAIETLGKNLENLRKVHGEGKQKRDEEGFFSRLKKTETNYAPSEVRLGMTPTDKEENLNYASKMLERTKRLQKEGQNPSEYFITGFGKGFADEISDLDKWSMGMMELQDAKVAKKVTNKVLNNEPLTPEEEAVIQSMVTNASTEMLYRDKLGRGYKAGGTVATSAPLMVDMMTGMAAVKGATSSIARGMVKYAAQQVAKAGLNPKTYAGALGRNAAKLATGLGKDMMYTTMHTSTLGAPRVLADYQNRTLGQTSTDVDEKGNAVYDGQVGQESGAVPAAKAFISTATDTGTELLGEHFGAMLKGVGHAMGVDKVSSLLPKNVAKYASEMKNSPEWKGVMDFAKAAHVSDPASEMAEEITANLVSYGIGDMTKEELISLDNNIDTFLGVAPMSVVFGTAGAVSYAKNQYKAHRRVKDFERKMDGQFGEDWREVSNALQKSDIQQTREFVKEQLMRNDFNEQDRDDFMHYVFANMQEQALSGMDVKPSTEELEARKHGIFRNYQKTKSAIDFVNPEDKEKLLRLSLDEIDNVTIGDGSSEAKPLSDEQKQKVIEFQGAARDYNWYMQHVEEKEEQARNKARAQVESLMNPSTGRVTRVYSKTDAAPVYILGGNIVADANGRVDAEKSSHTVYYRSPDGTVKMASPKIFKNILEDEEAETLSYNAGENAANEVLQREQSEVTPPIAFGTTFVKDGKTYKVHQPYDNGFKIQAEGSLTEDFISEDQLRDILEAEESGEDAGDVSTEGASSVSPANPVPSKDGVVSDMEAGTAAPKKPTLEQIVESLPRKKDGSIDYNGMTREQQFDYLEAKQGGEVALKQLDAEIKAAEDAFAKNQKEKESATGTKFIELADREEMLQSGLDELKQFRDAKRKELGFAETAPKGKVENPSEENVVSQNGDPDFESLNVDETLAALNSNLERDEVDAFVAARKKEYQKQINKLEKKALPMTTNMTAYVASKKQREEQIESLKRRMGYWDAVASELQKMNTPVGQDIADEVMSHEEPQNGHELAAQMLASGGIKLLHDDYKQQSGFGNREAQGMLGIFATAENGGVSVDKAAEDLMSYAKAEGLNFFDENDPTDAKNTILDVLSENRTKGELNSYIRRNREAEAKREMEAAQSEHEQSIAQNLHIPVEEYDGYVESMQQSVEENQLSDEAFNTFMSDLADQIEEYNEQRRIIEEGYDGGKVLPEEQPLHEKGTDAVAEGTEETDGRRTSENGTAPEKSEPSEQVEETEPVAAEGAILPNHKAGGNAHVKVVGSQINDGKREYLVAFASSKEDAEGGLFMGEKMVSEEELKQIISQPRRRRGGFKRLEGDTAATTSLSHEEQIQQKYEKEKARATSSQMSGEYGKALSQSKNLQEAIAHLRKYIEVAIADYKDFASRKYNHNTRNVYVGTDELSATKQSIEHINEQRRQRQMRNDINFAEEVEGWINTLMERSGINPSSEEGKALYQQGSWRDELSDKKESSEGEAKHEVKVGSYFGHENSIIRITKVKDGVAECVAYYPDPSETPSETESIPVARILELLEDGSIEDVTETIKNFTDSLKEGDVYTSEGEKMKIEKVDEEKSVVVISNQEGEEAEVPFVYFADAISSKDIEKVDDKARYSIKKGESPLELIERIAEAEEERRNKKADIAKKAGLIRSVYTRHVKDAGLLDRLAKKLGVTIEFVDKVADGQANAEIKGSTILIEKGNPNPVKFLIGHEITHRVQDLSPKAYAEFKEAVKKAMGKDFGKAVSELKSQYEAANVPISDAQLEDEVTADFAGDLAYYRNTLEKFVPEVEPSILRRILDVFKKIKDALVGKEKNSVEEAIDLIEAALKDAEKKVAEIVKMDEEAFNNVPKSDEASTDIRYSHKLAPQMQQETQEYFNKHYKKEGELSKNDKKRKPLRTNHLTQEQLDDAFATMNEFRDFIAPYIDLEHEGKRYLPAEVYGKSTIFTDLSYGKTMESSLICTRTLAYIDFVNEVKKGIGRPLTVRESFLASQMLYDIAVDPQCLYCYVSLDRKAYDEYLLKYIKQRDEVIAAIKEGKKSREELYKDFLAKRKDTPNMRNRFASWELVAKQGNVIDQESLALPETRSEIRNGSVPESWKKANDKAKKLKKEEKAAYKKTDEYMSALIEYMASPAGQIDDAEAYAQSASWAKKLEDYRSYTGELLTTTTASLRSLMKQYGLRFYSFSEYSPAFILENMQMITDAAVRGVTGFAYTKKTDFIRIFAPSNININCSCFGRMDSDGNVVMDESQGANWDEVKELRKQYPNVGAVYVATNDKMVEWALNQDWIDVIIPFHIVRTGADVADFYKWVNYTLDSSDRTNKNKSVYIHPNEHKNDKDTFLNLCKEQELKPRFANVKLADGRSVVEHPNYMRLVNETRRSVKETPVLQPVFNLDAAKKSFSTFIDEGGYYDNYFQSEEAFAEGVAQVVEDIKAGKGGNEVEYGRQDIPMDAAKLMQARTRKQFRHHNNSFTINKGSKYSLKANNSTWENSAKKAEARMQSIPEERRKKILDAISANIEAYEKEDLELLKKASDELTDSCKDVFELVAANRYMMDVLDKPWCPYSFSVWEGKHKDESLLSYDKNPDKWVGSLQKRIDNCNDVDDLEYYKIFASERIPRGYKNLVRKPINQIKKKCDERIKEILKGSNPSIKADFMKADLDSAGYSDLFHSLCENRVVAELFDKVMSVAETMPLKYHLRKTGNKTAGDFFADIIRINLNVLNDPQRPNEKKAETMLHELIHAVTVYAVEAVNNEKAVNLIHITPEMREAVKALNNIYDTIKANKSFEGMYGLTNTKEMLSELSNPEFRDKLHAKGLWQRIIDAFKKLFGIETDEENNALDAVSGILDYMLDNFDIDASNEYVHIAKQGKIYLTFSKQEAGTLAEGGSYFSGGGLLEEGLKQVLNPKFAVEYDKAIAGVYRNNFGDHIVTADVRDVDPTDLAKKVNGRVQYFHASPVCKNFSTAKQNAEELPLDKVTAEATAKAIREMQPEVVTIENVAGYKKSESLGIITDVLDELGYTWDNDVYNAADYGAATSRSRMILRAVREGLTLPPKPAHTERAGGWYHEVEDLIEYLPETNVPQWMSDRLAREGVDVSSLEKPLYVLGTGTPKGGLRMAYADELMPTLTTTGGDRIFMPDGRVLAPSGRVFARISGMSDDYTLPESDAAAHKIIGNGIPVKLTQAVIAPLIESRIIHAKETRKITEEIDKEYLEAARNNDIPKATELFRKYVYEQADDNIVPIDYAVGYRAADHARIAHEIKEGKEEVIREAAFRMQPHVPEGSILIPMPSSSGKAESGIIRLAEMLAKMTGSEVRDVMQGLTRGSVYEAKKNGRKMTSEMLGFHLTEELPKDRNVIIVDNVIDRGTTAAAAVRAAKGATVLAYAFTNGNKPRSAQLKLADPITHDDMGKVIPLSERFNPQKDDVRYSLKGDHKSLIGVHNISEDKLRKALKMGGLANPSMAVIDSDTQNHDDYGAISLIAPSALVDAKSGKNVGTYTADAWTPTYPQIMRKMTNKGYQKLLAMLKELDDPEMRSKIKLDWDNYLESEYSIDGLKYWFLKETGRDPQKVYEKSAFSDELKKFVSENRKQKEDSFAKTSFSEFTDEQRKEFLRLLEQNDKGKYETLTRKLTPKSDTNERVKAIMEKRNNDVDTYGAYVDGADNMMGEIARAAKIDGRLDEQETTRQAAQTVQNKGLDKEFDKWLEDKFEETEAEEVWFDGYTPSGNRKYIKNTLENVSRWMKKQGRNGATGVAGFSRFVATLATPKKSLDAIRKSSDNLKGDEEYQEFREEWSEVYLQLANAIKAVGSYSFDSGENRLEEVAKMADPREYLKKEYGVEVSDWWIEDFKALKKAITKSFPARYFETKFERPVHLNEFVAAVVPESIDPNLRGALSQSGLQVYDYKADDKESRHAAMQQAIQQEGVRFSLKSAKPFYSNAEHAVESISQNKATPEQWLKMIQKNGGLKAGEDKWLGLSDWLNASDAKTLTKDEVLDYIRKNEIQIEEVNYAKEYDDPVFAAIRRKYGDEMVEAYGFSMDYEEPEAYINDTEKAAKVYNKYNDEPITPHSDGSVSETDRKKLKEFGNHVAEEIIEVLKNSNDRPINDTRLEYTMRGLDNKREIALVVPSVEPWNANDDIHFGDAGDGRAVAWARFGETTDAEGNRVLVIDEIQSKRHQEGREKGYASLSNKELEELEEKLERAETEWGKARDAYQEAFDYERRHNFDIKDLFWNENGDQLSSIEIREILNGEGEKGAKFMELLNQNEKIPELRKVLDEKESEYHRLSDEYDKVSNRIPDAPFEKNWPELVFKRMLRYAAENGYDKVAWTTGKQQADRYDLNKSISAIEKTREGDEYNITIDAPNRDSIACNVDEEGVITWSSQNFEGRHLSELIGQDLAKEVMDMDEGVIYPSDQPFNGGGNGMNAFYDKMIPSFVNKYVKKWGTKVGEVYMPTLREADQHMHSVDVTPEMRESVMKGQPMFRQSMREAQRAEASRPSYVETIRFAREVSSKLNIPTFVIDSQDEIHDAAVRNALDSGVRVKGWFSSGKVYIFAPNVSSLGDIQRTVLHEGVAHYGLRKLVGEDNMDMFLDDVYRSLDKKTMRRVANMISQYGYDVREATEEYMAYMVEDGFNQSVFDRIKIAFKNLLRRMGISLRINDAELKYILWRSARNLQMSNPIDLAQNIAMQSEMGVGNYSYGALLREFGTEAREIINKAQREHTYMLAPNGKSSHLNEKQWVQVRTKAFKEWFGDWENNPSGASKILDENGEPKVLYHGSPIRIDQFDASRLGYNTGSSSSKEGFFFTDLREMASAYAKGSFVKELRESDIEALLYEIPDERLNSVADKHIREEYSFSDSIEDYLIGEMYLDEDYKPSHVLEAKRRYLADYIENSISDFYDYDANVLSELGVHLGEVNEVYLNVREPKFVEKEADGNSAEGFMTETITEARKKGYDGVVFESVDEGKYVTPQYVVFDPTQIKSANENNGDFDPNDPDVRFRFVGERGAENMDKAQKTSHRTINLEVARRMEKAMKGAKAIKMATGWERGRDGKWRYETDDIHLKRTTLDYLQDVIGDKRLAYLFSMRSENNDFTINDWREVWNNQLMVEDTLKSHEETVPLRDVVDDKELFEAYPELEKEGMVHFYTDYDGYDNGSSNSRKSFISVNMKPDTDLRGTLSHEIQHIIQYKEGFAKGGDPSYVRDELIELLDEKRVGKEYIQKMRDLSDKIRQDVYKMEQAVRWIENPNSFKESREFYQQSVDNIEDAATRKAVEYYWDVMHDLQQGLLKGYQDGFSELMIGRLKEDAQDSEAKNLTLSDIALEVLKQADRDILLDMGKHITETKEADEFDRLMRLNKTKTEDELYHALAGETEARNVKRRLSLTPSEKRKSLAKATEDVAREDQIVVFHKRANARYSLKKNQEELDAVKSKAVKDGTFMKAPNGKKSNLNERQWLQVRTTAFKNWFGDWENDPKNASKVVDENGEPLVVYHGTKSEFNAFDSKHIGTNLDYGTSGYGFYFTTDKQNAQNIARNAEGNGTPRVMEAFLNIRNPKEDVSTNELQGDEKSAKRLTDKAKAVGHDGIAPSRFDLQWYVVFEPTQIKSATDNNGNFDSAENDIRYSLKADNSRQKYESVMRSKIFQTLEPFQDSTKSIKVVQDIVSEVSGKPIKTHENTYVEENRLSSINDEQKRSYRRNFWQPIIDEVYELMKNAKIDYDDVKKYVISKHGLERNEVFARRDAVRDTENEFAPRYQSLQKKLQNGSISTAEYNSRKSALDTLKQVEEDKRYAKNRKKDYSGLSSLFKGEKDYEGAALKYVLSVERKGKTNPLWTRINTATKEIVKMSYESGMITKDMRDKLNSQFDHYVPLRGWKDKTVDEAYDYFTKELSVLSPVLKKAKGRKSIAFDPFANIGNMAEGAIVTGNKNRLKQTFLNMAIGHPTELLSVSPVWYVFDPSIDDWRISFPVIQDTDDMATIAEKMQKHEEAMNLQKANGLATKVKPKLNVDYVMPKQFKDEHTILVRNEGKEYIILVNGNPRVAQAVNGLMNPNVNKFMFFQVVNAVNRWMSSVNTSRNPEFVLTNMAKDIILSLNAVSVKENYKYWKTYKSNIVKCMPAIFRGIRGKADMSNEYDVAFKEFVDNGSETGYMHIMSPKEYEREIKTQIKKLSSKWMTPGTALDIMNSKVELFNRFAEDIARFAVYKTSKDMGKTPVEAAHDAKEITVNFNKKGAGFNSMGKNIGWYGNTMGALAGIARAFYLFFNPAVQSMNNLAKMAKISPTKFAVMMGSWYAVGMVVPMLNTFMGELFGDDGDDETYFDLSPWERRRNLCFGYGDSYIKIPLPPELRAIYGLGEYTYSSMMGKEKGSGMDKFKDALSLVTELLPINPLENPDDLTSAFVPDIYKAKYDIDRNKDYMGRPIWKDTPFNTDDPEWQKAYKGTSSLLVGASKYANELFNFTDEDKAGQEFAKGVLDFNPAKVEYVIEQYLGGMAKFANKSIKTADYLGRSAVNGEWQDGYDSRIFPFINRFYKTVGEREKNSGIEREYRRIGNELRKFKHRIDGVKRQWNEDPYAYDWSLNTLEDSDQGKKLELFLDCESDLKDLYDFRSEATPKEVEMYDREIIEVKKNFLQNLENLERKK